MKNISFVDANLNTEIERVSIKKSFETDYVLMSPGDIVQYVPLVQKGSIRIVLQNYEGEEYFLYHIFPGETCAMSISCCQAHKKSEIKAIIEENVHLLLIPVKYVDEWMKYPEWKKFISDTQSQRFSELLETIELIAFSKLDEQLWHYLVKRVQATGNKNLKITHQEIAQELNSPREVITRLLHQLQKRKKITLERNLITLHEAV